MRTEVSRYFAASRSRVYAALTNADDVARWRFPAGMSCHVHQFEAREGGRIRISLTYELVEGVGKSSGRTDTYQGRFVRLVRDELVVEIDEFETADPEFSGEMTMTVRLSDGDDGGTHLSASHDGIPAGVSAADNETGWREALDRLAGLVEPENVRGSGSHP
jgi:uncharacterized protein YndB with AHSA1/START domain